MLALLSGLVMAVLMTVGVAMGLEINSKKTGKVKKFAVILFAPIMGMFIGSASVSSAIPMMAAIAIGEETEIQYTVAKVTGRNARNCRNPITLEGLPFIANKLCGFSAGVGSSFRRGDMILVTGSGTVWGVVPLSACRGEYRP